LEDQLEDVRALAEAYAHHIMAHRTGRLCEIKKIDGEIYIVMTAYGAHIDEFGSVDQPPNAPLRRAMDALGLKFVLDPKP
jgi:hypothetical protein